jgi:hypothetical protein
MLIDKLYRTVKALDLNLKGKTVVTEAASGPYVVTPVLAALAGARVFAFTRSTRYGSVEAIFSETRKLIAECDFMKLDINLVEELSPEIIAQADLITNSGHLRPLDEDKLKHAKDGLVIPLMYEAWEWRDEDMDLAYVRKRGFALGATNERHPDVDVFNYLGDMALKLIFDAGICPYSNRFILICNNDFGPYIAKVLARNCAGLLVIDEDGHRNKYQDMAVDWTGGFPAVSIPESYRDAEAVIFTAYPFTQEWIGNNNPVLLDSIKAQLSDPYILRYCGDLSVADLDQAEVRYFPSHVTSGHMGVLPSAVGFDPIIRLQAGGLKAGEALMSGKHTHKNLPIVELI